MIALLDVLKCGYDTYKYSLSYSSFNSQYSFKLSDDITYSQDTCIHVHSCMCVPTNIQISAVYLHLCFLISHKQFKHVMIQRNLLSMLLIFLWISYLGERYQNLIRCQNYHNWSFLSFIHELNYVPHKTYMLKAYPRIPECECIWR